MIGVSIMGATGSIGDSTIDLIRQHSDQYHIVALSGHNNIEKLIALAIEFRPQLVAVTNPDNYVEVKTALAGLSTTVVSGKEGLVEMACLQSAKFVVAGIVGCVGMESVMAAVDSGKTILLANKESLIVAGELLMKLAEEKGARIIPLDSEHNAIHQCLGNDYQVGTTPANIDKIVLTASGGPFWDKPMREFHQITPRQAVAHPRWNMGAKISVDSATLMNKGLEMIEAYWLFALPIKSIEAMIHPQSIVHSMVYYRDSSVLAQMGVADMRIPIAYGFSLASGLSGENVIDRIQSGVKSLDIVDMSRLEFYPPDNDKFPCLTLAQRAMEAGGTAAAILNFANEVSVNAFLEKQIRFDKIPEINAKLLQEIEVVDVESLDQLLELELEVKQKTLDCIEYDT